MNEIEVAERRGVKEKKGGVGESEMGWDRMD